MNSSDQRASENGLHLFKNALDISTLLLAYHKHWKSVLSVDSLEDRVQSGSAKSVRFSTKSLESQHKDLMAVNHIDRDFLNYVHL